MTANINEFLLRLSILRSSSTSLRDSPWVSTLPQMAPILWAASQGRLGQPFRQRSASARRPRRPRLARMRRNRVRARLGSACQRYKAASLLAGRGAAQPAPYSKPAPSRAPSAPRPPGTARALVHARSLASFALGHLVVLALDRRQCPCSPRKRRGRRGDRRPLLRTQTLRRLGAARLVFGGCPITGAQSSRHAPCAAATACRRRCAAHVARQRSPGARIRADAVEQQESRDAAAAADTINDGLALRRDGQEGRELPWV